MIYKTVRIIGRFYFLAFIDVNYNFFQNSFLIHLFEFFNIPSIFRGGDIVFKIKNLPLVEIDSIQRDNTQHHHKNWTFHFLFYLYRLVFGSFVFLELNLTFRAFKNKGFRKLSHTYKAQNQQII